MPAPYADIALALPMWGTFQYGVPENLAGNVEVGKRVFVSVRNRRMVGYIVGFSDKKLFDEVKSVESVIDEKPILSDHALSLARWMADYYCCGLGQAIDACMPAPFKKGKFLMKSRSKKAIDGAQMDQPQDLILTEHQRKAYLTVLETIQVRQYASFLLHGVTGSGKTEVYMHLIREILKLNRGCIVLVPEISLTPQTVDRFYSRFGDGLAVIHSRLTAAHRVEEWHRIRSGKARVVVGARSAVFSPVHDLGLVIIDEEHETSYKQDETPRYHTREVADQRARLAQAVLLLGSATPSLESYHASESGRIGRLELPDRIEKRPLPEVRIIDMRRQEKLKRESIFSFALEQAVKESLEKKEQVMLLLNRRGFSTYLHCSTCGAVMMCEHCRIVLAYHFDKGALLCHSCHYQAAPPRLCPACQKSYLHYFGIGTQKVEQEARRLFPLARIGRMDSDSTARKDAHEIILRSFRRAEIDILIGTQMIAKGHDFPNVSLIGVISADTALHIPDFRAAERTFCLLTQVAGRTGRGDVPGRVIVQTYVPTHYSIQSAKDHNYSEFYQKEIIFRNELNMPPLTRLIKIIVSGRSEKEVARQIMTLAKLFRERLSPSWSGVLGPAPCIVSKEKGSFYWNLFIKGTNDQRMIADVRKTIGDFKKSAVTITIDVDPQ